MKKQSLFLVAVLICFTAFAQSVGIGTTTPNSSSMLEIKASNKGLLIPRTSTASRTAIVNPAKGLMVYDTTTSSFWFHNGSAWTQISAGSNGWSLTGNSGTNPATDFIGTTDDQPLLFRIKNQPAGIIDSSHGNTASGFKTLFSNTTGLYNTATGYLALSSNTTGAGNTAIGMNALFSSNALYNTAIGMNALFSNTTGGENIANGDYVLYNNNSGSQNTAIGSGALFSNNASYNTAIGYRALHSNTAGYYNTASGWEALYFSTTGYDNTANGYEALLSNTIGVDNTANGYEALLSNTTGTFNTANGARALYSNTTGYYNTVNGVDALYSNTTGNYNTVNGVEALYSNTTGSGNIANGYNALSSNTTGSDNIANGYSALSSNTTGNNNTANGFQALYYNTTGYYNTAIGAGAGCIPGTTPSNFTALGYNAGMVGSGSNTVEIGNTSVTWIGGQVGWSTYSDGRIKDNIVANVPGLAFISRLRPVTYNLNLHRQNLLCGTADTVQWEGKHDIEKITQTGFVVQEVEQAATESNYNFNGVQKPKNEHDLYSLNYSSFVVPLVKAVQEQQAMIQNQQQQIDALLKRIEALEKK